MNFRNYLTKNNCWGKLIGAGLGFLTAGPAGALLGVFIGNLFDKGLSEHLSKPHLAYHTEKRTGVKQAFQRAVFSTMGHIAKADGRVSEQEIKLTNTVIRELNLSYKERLAAQKFFTQGKSQDFNMTEPLSLLKSLAKGNPRLHLSLIQFAYRMAQVDGLTPAKITILNVLLRTFNLAPFHEQAHARQAYERYFNGFHSGNQRRHSSTHHAFGADPIMEEDAYRTLNISSGANKQEVKRAYRKLISEYHPDRKIAKGATEAEVKSANEKTQTIRKAYEHICKQRGW